MMTETNTIQGAKCSRAGRVGAAVLVGTGTALAGVNTTFASPPTADEVAGGALEDMGDRGVSFVTTYVLPTAVTVLGAGLALALLLAFGKRVKSWVR